MKNRELILSGPMGLLFLSFGLPAIIGMLILQVYNLTDAVFIGHFVGKEAVGAVGIAYIAALANQIVFILVGNGAGALFSIAVGKKDYGRCGSLTGTTLVFSALPSVVFAAALYFTAGYFIPYLGAEGSIGELTLRYLRILVLGMPFLSVLGSIHSLLRSEGFIMESTLYMAASVILNIVLDFIFICILKMNIEGAAIATVISQIAGLALVSAHYIKGKSIVKPHMLNINLSLLPQIVRNGSGQAFMHISGIVFMAFLYNALSRYGGDGDIIVLTASLRVWEYFFFILLGASIGMQTIAGISFGAERYSRVKETFSYFLRLGMIVSVISWLLFMAFPGTFLSWFINDPQLVTDGIVPFRMINSIFFLLGTTSMISMLFVSIGRGELSLLYVVLQQIVFFVPLVIILPRLTGVIGIWMTVPASGILSFLVLLMIFASVWRGITRREAQLRESSAA